jgi:hypothetical protein
MTSASSSCHLHLVIFILSSSSCHLHLVIFILSSSSCYLHLVIFILSSSSCHLVTVPDTCPTGRRRQPPQRESEILEGHLLRPEGARHVHILITKWAQSAISIPPKYAVSKTCGSRFFYALAFNFLQWPKLRSPFLPSPRLSHR